MLLSLPQDPLMGFVIAVLYVAAAGAVTVHVLLRKRSVPAAIGWIGLAWLSPVFGAVLYYVFGINRIARRALRLGRAAARPPSEQRREREFEQAGRLGAIAKVVSRLTHRPLAEGNRIAVLQGGDEAYPAMLSAIREAGRSIAFSAYIFRGDEAGQAFVAALGEAQARGVEVRVLIDGIGGGYIFSPAADGLRRRGVRVARFLHYWLPWRMTYLNLRNHKKILVVDGAVGFTGGMNVGAENLGADDPAGAVQDYHFRIDGPAVRHLMETFANDWNFATDESLEDEVWWPELRPAGDVRARGIGSGPDEAEGLLETTLAAAISAAERRIRVVTPYFLPESRLLSALQLATLRGVAVEIALPIESDLALVDWATRAHLAFFGPAIAVHLMPGPFCHQKLMTVDGEWSLVGTSNWDVRSMRLNFEFNLECYDAAFTQSLDRRIDEMIAKAERVRPEALAARPLPLRLRDGAARLLLPYL